MSRPPFTASTSTTRPTKERTYLPNSPRHQCLRSASCIGISPASALLRSSGVCDNGLHFIAVAERAARIGHDQVAFAQPLADFGVGIGVNADLDQARRNDAVARDLHARPFGPVAHRRAGNRYAAAAVGVDRGAGERSEPKLGVALQRNPRPAELRSLIDRGR